MFLMKPRIQEVVNIKAHTFKQVTQNSQNFLMKLCRAKFLGQAFSKSLLDGGKLLTVSRGLLTFVGAFSSPLLPRAFELN